MASIIDAQVEAIRAQVGTGRAICGLSGGVDSAVAAALVHKAIGAQLTCVFVDTGLMRKGEGEQVVETFRRHRHRADPRPAPPIASSSASPASPIRRTSARPSASSSSGSSRTPPAASTDARFLVQGTLYPDVIESGTKDAAKIKSHHNVGGLPEDMEFELVEPLRALFKDEVRQVGDRARAARRDRVAPAVPGPRPGRAHHRRGHPREGRDPPGRRRHRPRRDQARPGLEREIWQAFAVLPDIRSVGVMGDERTYGHPIIIRAVTSPRTP